MMKTEEELIWESYNIKKWFGDSKVVDDSGKPLKVYHGTSTKFNKFDYNKHIGGLYWFTSNKEDILSGLSGAKSSKHIIEAFLKIENPANRKLYDNLTIMELKSRGYDGAILGSTYVVFSDKQIKIIN